MSWAVQILLLSAFLMRTGSIGEGETRSWAAGHCLPKESQWGHLLMAGKMRHSCYVPEKVVLAFSLCNWFSPAILDFNGLHSMALKVVDLWCWRGQSCQKPQERVGWSRRAGGSSFLLRKTDPRKGQATGVALTGERRSKSTRSSSPWWVGSFCWSKREDSW